MQAHLLQCLVAICMLCCSWSCKQRSADKPLPAAPAKITRLDPVSRPDASPEEALYEVAPFAPTGPGLPRNATILTLSGDQTQRPVLANKATVLIVPDQETYMAQLNPLLAQLDTVSAQAWMQHPTLPIAFPIALKDEPGFQAWLDDLGPGKLRVIHRADGFELQTNMGKLPGVDPNGPSVPNRGGKIDLATLQDGLRKIKARFKDSSELCFVPSYGMPVEQVAQAFAANFISPESPIFEKICLVYARPKP